MSRIPVALALAAVSALAAQTAAAPPRIPCGAIILRVASGRAGGYRVVLGVVSVPPAYRPQIAATGRRPWSYVSKAGLVVHGGAPPVSVSVAKAWRGRAAVSWGDSGTVSALRIASCAAGTKPWNAYAGGFYLRDRSACVPLVFRVGARTAIVRFGIGRRCP